MGNPFDLNRDGRWSVPERALTHYGVDPIARGGGDRRDGCAGCGCALALLVVPLALVAVVLALSS